MWKATIQKLQDNQQTRTISFPHPQGTSEPDIEGVKLAAAAAASFPEQGVAVTASLNHRQRENRPHISQPGNGLTLTSQTLPVEHHCLDSKKGRAGNGTKGLGAFQKGKGLRPKGFLSKMRIGKKVFRFLSLGVLLLKEDTFHQIFERYP